MQQPVYIRSFTGEPRWIPGTVEARAGPRSYTVMTSEGRVERRHVDHIRKRQGSAGSSVESTDMSVFPKIGEESPDQQQMASPTEFRGATEEELDGGAHTAGSARKKSTEQSNEQEPVGGPRRYPQRTRKKPQRLGFATEGTEL